MARILLLAFAIGLALHAPTAICAQEGPAPRLDCFGDPLPVGALARLGTVRFHRCICAAYSPDGKIIATADSEEISLWDAATSKKIRQLAVAVRQPAGLTFSHNGKKLAAIGWLGTAVQVWDLDTFDCILLTQTNGGSGGGDWSNAAAFSSDDKTLIAATYNTLFVWDLASGKKLKELPFRSMEKPIPVQMIAFSEDGTVAATQDEKIAHLWDTQTGKLLHEIELLSWVETMRFSRDGKALVVAGSGSWMNIFSVETGKKMHSLPVSQQVVSVAFSPDGKTLAAASNANRRSSSTTGAAVIQLWDFTNLKAPPVKFPAPGIDFVTFSPDSKTVAWGCHEQTLRFMDRAGKDQRPTASHTGAIKSLVYLPDGKRIVSASEDGTLRIWDSATGESLSVLGGHVGPVLGLALFPNGKLLASCGLDGTFRLWDLERGQSLSVLKDEGNSVVAAAFSADGKQLASGGYRGVVFLRDPATGKILEKNEAQSITSLAFSPDGKTLAALCGRGTLLLQDLVTKKDKKIPVASGGSCAYSPDGRFLAVGCNETLLLLDPATNGVVKTLPGHWNHRGGVAFSADSRYLASVSDGWGKIADRSIRVFELATGTEIHSFKRESPIFAAAFSPDGSKLAVGGADATVLILDLHNLTDKKRRDLLTEKELLSHWESLGAAAASEAFQARADLLHAPQSTVPFLVKRLQPAPAVDAKRVEGWIKNLDSKAFRERDEATKELEQLGELVQAPLRKALAGDISLEVRQRLQVLLGKLEEPTPSKLRNLRAIEILEGIGTPEAYQSLERLAKGNADGLLTFESRQAIARREKKSAPLPENPIAKATPAPGSPPGPPPGPMLPDLNGDPMPPGAIARLGSARWRLTDEPRRIVVSADGKMLAVVTKFAGLEMLDAQTGRSIERPTTGFFTWGFDLRMTVALSPDWQSVAAPESGGLLAVLDRGKKNTLRIEYGRKQESYPVVPEEVEGPGNYSTFYFECLSAMDFSPDGKRLIGSVRFEWQCSGGKASKEVKENHLGAWDASTGKQIWKSAGPAKVIHSVKFSPDGKTITAVDRDSVSFWDAVTGRESRRWQSKDPLFSATHSPDQNWIATGSKDEILLWDVATGKVVQRLALPGDEIKAVAFSPDGKLLAGGGDKTIRFWDPLTGKSHGDCSAFPRPVEAVAFSGDGKTLFSGHQQENVLRRWNVDDRKPSGEFSGPTAPVRILLFSPDSRKILASSSGEDFYLWEAETGKPLQVPKKDDNRLMTEWLASSGQAALLRCEESVGSQFAMLFTGKIDRFDQLPGFLGASVDGQRILVQTEKDKSPCLSVVKLPKGNVKEQDKLKEHVEREFLWKEGNEVHAALSPDGKTVAAAGNDVVCFFDVLTGQERRYKHPTNVRPEFLFRTQTIKFSADGSRVALVGSEGKIRVLAVSDGRRLAEFATKSRNLTGLAFSPDGQTLLTTSFMAPVYAWEVATGQMVRQLEAATYVYSPDNRVLAGSAKTLKLFDLYSGRHLRECQAEGNTFGNFAFSPNSQWLAASCSDTTILVWPTSSAGAKAGKPLDEKILAELLEKGNAADAYEAIALLIADPDRALAMLERRIHAIPKLDANHFQRLIADLDSDKESRRNAAMKDLDQLGTLVEPVLRATLSSEKVPLGSKQRIEKLLQDLDEKLTAISAEDVFHVRAIQALERIGTIRARQLLENLAQGAETSPRTRAANEALWRSFRPGT